MKIHHLTYPLPSEFYIKEVVHFKEGSLAIKFGTVFLKKGARIPNEGFSRHPEHEISIITKGKIEMLNEDETVLGYLNAGDAVHINAFEPQAGNVLEDTEIIYFLAKDTQSNSVSE